MTLFILKRNLATNVLHSTLMCDITELHATWPIIQVFVIKITFSFHIVNLKHIIWLYELKNCNFYRLIFSYIFSGYYTLRKALIKLKYYPPILICNYLPTTVPFDILNLKIYLIQSKIFFCAGVKELQLKNIKFIHLKPITFLRKIFGINFS